MLLLSSGNIDSAILDLPELVNSYQLYKTEKFETFPDDQFYIAFTSARYPLELTFPQWRNKCNFQVQFNLTDSENSFLANPESDAELHVTSSISSQNSEFSISPRIHVSSTNLTNKNLKNRASSIFQENESSRIAFEIFNTDYNQVLQFQEIPMSFCLENAQNSSDNFCHENPISNRYFYPVPGVYSAFYGRVSHRPIEREKKRRHT